MISYRKCNNDIDYFPYKDINKKWVFQTILLEKTLTAAELVSQQSDYGFLQHWKTKQKCHISILSVHVHKWNSKFKFKKWNRIYSWIIAIQTIRRKVITISNNLLFYILFDLIYKCTKYNLFLMGYFYLLLS